MTANIDAINTHNNNLLHHPKYRPDIDGLRAIAVISVVIYHAFPKFIKGGFIGVDIFFVISGFLISTIIMNSLNKDSFSFVEFYSRRIKRIFPALTLVLVTCFLLGWLILLAEEYKQLGKHIAGGAGFISNFLFWSESGYFDNSAETKPLLHLWSLGIEEQFYIVWPLLLWLVWKRGINLFSVIITVSIISFGLNLNKVYIDPTAAFYSPQTRFWELLSGSMIAYLALRKERVFPETFHKYAIYARKTIALIGFKTRKESHDIQSTVGAVLILFGLAVITKNVFYPGWWALLPTLGTALIIHAGPKAWLNRTVLSNPLLVWFGLISFPLYLWHWPLLSFAQIIESSTPSHSIRFLAILASIGLAWLTFKFIEKPIRANQERKTLITLISLMIAIAVVGYFTYQQDGLAFRAAQKVTVKNIGDVGSDEFQLYQYKKFYLCTPSYIQKQALVWNNTVRCFQSKQNDIKTIAIIGDSHAEHLFIGLAETLVSDNVVYYTRNSIPSINNTEFKDIFHYVIHDPNIKSIIISAYWNLRLDEIAKDSNLESELTKTVAALTAANKKVYIADDVPNFSFDPKKCKFSRVFSDGNSCTEDAHKFQNQYMKYSQTLSEIVKNNSNVSILKMAGYFCDQGNCQMAQDGVLFYRDRNHLNINGSKFLAKQLVMHNAFKTHDK